MGICSGCVSAVLRSALCVAHERIRLRQHAVGHLDPKRQREVVRVPPALNATLLVHLYSLAPLSLCAGTSNTFAVAFGRNAVAAAFVSSGRSRLGYLPPEVPTHAGHGHVQQHLLIQIRLEEQTLAGRVPA